MKFQNILKVDYSPPSRRGEARLAVLTTFELGGRVFKCRSVVFEGPRDVLEAFVSEKITYEELEAHTRAYYGT